MSATPPVEFSFPVDVISLPPSGRLYEIEADESARARVAARLGLVLLGSLAAKFNLLPRAGGMIDVTGTVRAKVTQTCVITLAPVQADVREEIEVRFVLPLAPAPTPKAAKKTRGKAAEEPEDLIALGEEEPPEEAVGGEVDLGELAVVHLALGLDPYPRAPGASFQAGSWGEKGEKIVTEGPFAVLAGLKAKAPPKRQG